MLALFVELLVDDLSDSLSHGGTALHLLGELCSTDTEVVEDHLGLATETRHYGVGEVVDALAGLGSLQLGELQIFAEVFQRDPEIVGLYSSLHQLKVGHGAVCGLP